MIKSKIGLEAEFLLKNSKGELVVPPSNWDRDGFPLLGEIRGKEGKVPAETLTNFIARRMEIADKINNGSTIHFLTRERVPLALYKKANRAVGSQNKDNALADIKNIYDTDITEFSDQIVSKGRIQGIHVSCGLHVHFSCEEVDELEVEEEQYEQIVLPIAMPFAMPWTEQALNQDQAAAKELINPCLYLYRRKGYEKKQTLTARASRLNKPAIHYIVSKMDGLFFDRFAPPEKERTKYRQPGFYELKPYGFEYRSLPFTPEVEAALPEITKAAFDLLKEINE